jgi:SnoaL-like protein
VDALKGKDIGNLGNVLHQNLRWESDSFDGPTGLADAGVFLQGIWGAFDDLNLVHTLIADDGDSATFEFRFTGKHARYLPGVGHPSSAAPGTPVSLTGIAIVRFQDDKVISARTYWNCAAFLAQLGIRAHMRADPVPLG